MINVNNIFTSLVNSQANGLLDIAYTSLVLIGMDAQQNTHRILPILWFFFL